MSARRMGAALLMGTLAAAGGVTRAEAQTPSPAPFAFVDEGNTAQQPAPAPAPAPPAPPATPATQAPPAPLPAPAAARPPSPPRSSSRLTAFSAVLVTADADEATAGRGAGPQPEVPAAAKKALASVSSFLPYKSYSMADAALVSATVNYSFAVRMRDPEIPNTLLRLSVHPSFSGVGGPSSSETINVRVSLSELTMAGADEKIGRTIISTSADVTLGETVVVGTSRVGGGRKAYVLLLTAIGK